jgi:histidine triad (HIT) family protein
MSAPGCIFCEIISGKRSARIVAENINAVAFLDAFPLAVGHVLVVPRTHFAKIQDMASQDSAAVFELVQKLSSAVEDATDTTGSTIAVHNGRVAGQEIPHVHVHIIPRRSDDGAAPVHVMFKKRPKLEPEQMDSMRSMISSRVKTSND